MSGRLATRSTPDARARIGLPTGIRACLFDLDGVLTDTVRVHSAAWKAMFDGFLLERAGERGDRFVPFDAEAEYFLHVDGKPRAEGVRSFLEARGIRLPTGRPDDPPDAPTVHGLGNRKNELVLALLEAEGVEAYAGSVRFVQAACEAGLRRAVVSSSVNARNVLAAAGIEALFEVVVDGEVARRRGLRGKPAPDAFVEAARALGVEPAHAAVFEDALAGVEAARAGGFGLVVAVDRAGNGDALRARGSDIVVVDLGQLLAGRRVSRVR